MEKAISTIIAAIIISAFALVWRNAMSIDSRVAEAQATQTQLISTLAETLARQQTAIEALSNTVALMVTPIGPMVSEDREQVIRAQVADTFSKK